MPKYKLLISLAFVLVALLLAPTGLKAAELDPCPNATGLITDSSIFELTKMDKYYHLSIEKYLPFKYSLVEASPLENGSCVKRSDGWNCQYLKIEEGTALLYVDFIKNLDGCVEAWAEIPITGAEKITPEEERPYSAPEVSDEMKIDVPTLSGDPSIAELPDNPFHALDAMQGLMTPAGGGGCSLVPGSNPNYLIILIAGLAIAFLGIIKKKIAR